MLTARVQAASYRLPQHLKDYVQDGRLTLGLRDAILLTLENNSNVQIDETQIEAQKFNLLGQFQPFDPSAKQSQHQSLFVPLLQPTAGSGRSATATLNSLSQTGQIAYTQTFSPGTNFQAVISVEQVFNQQFVLLLQSVFQLAR